MKCPNCGEDDVVVIDHSPPHGGDCPKSHHYCRNCDFGLCCGEC